MFEILLFFVAASLLLYVLLGGSDYGAGILEILPAGKLREKQKQVINRAMGPVWEANHVWLIVLVVILFMGFPKIFTTVTVALHLPILALLVGIIVRGTAFTFRHFDAVQSEKSQRVYTVFFGLASAWTSLWLGIIAASLTRGTINPSALNAWDAYVAPWLGIYPVTVGFFVACIFAFLASVYLIGETDDAEVTAFFARRAIALNALVLVAGALVFAVSTGEKTNLPVTFFDNPWLLGVVTLVILFFAAQCFFIRKKNAVLSRITAGAQVTLILLGWGILNAPNALVTVDGPISFRDAAAPEVTVFQLTLALLVGSCFIFPSLFFLLKVFKTKQR